MSTALIAVTLVLLLSHTFPRLAQWRRMDTVLHWLGQLSQRLGLGREAQLGAVLLQIVLPGLLLFLLQQVLQGWGWGLPLLAYSVLLLFLCWGPRDLDADVQALRDADDASAGDAARRALGLDGRRDDASQLVSAVFRAGLQRWFGPLLWFVLLGGAGAVMFRLSQLASRETPPRGSALASLRTVFEWPVAQLMTLGLAIVGNFDLVLQAWRAWHQAHGGWLLADTGFLDAAARRSVGVELREQIEDREDAGELVPDVIEDPQDPVLADALSLLWRILLAWMAVFAVLVIAGIAS